MNVIEKTTFVLVSQIALIFSNSKGLYSIVLVPYLLVVVTACLLTAQCNVSCQLLHLCTQEAVNTYTHVWKTKTPSLSYHQSSMGFLLIGTSKTMVVYVREGVKIRKNRLYLFRAAALFVCKYKNRRLKKIQKKWLGEKKKPVYLWHQIDVLWKIRF